MIFPNTEKTLSSLALAIGKRQQLPSGASNALIMNKGMSSGDFSGALADNATKHVRTLYDATARHLTFCDVIEVTNFMPVSMPATDVPLELQPVGENGEVSVSTIFIGAGQQQAQLYSYAQIIGVSRQLIVNDQLGIIENAIEQQGAVAARTEAALVYNAMESNPDLDDGSPVFHADHENVLTGGMAWETLGAAMTILRKQPANTGHKTDLELRHLVVGAGLEIHALKAVVDAGLEGRVTVTATALLPDDRWYALADPNISPCVAVLRLQGAEYPVRVERWQPDFERDGSAVKASADLGATMVGRVGIIRGTVTGEDD